MSSVKKFSWCTLITLAIWFVAMVAPGILSAGNPTLKLFLLAVMLPLGWWSGCSISKGRFSTCVRVNLYIFIAIEGIGTFEALTYMMSNLAFSTGQISTDVNGIAYADYPATFGLAFLYAAVYLALCCYLAAKTPVKSSESSEPSTSEATLGNREQRKILTEEISRMNAALHTHDITYANNKKILEESFSDEDLERMVAHGEFPADKVGEYIAQRNNLAFFVESAPQIRKMHTGMIRDLEAQLEALKPKRKPIPKHRIIISALIAVIIVLLLVIFVLIHTYVLPAAQKSNGLTEPTIEVEETVPGIARPQNGQIIHHPRGTRESPMTFGAATGYDFLVTLDPVDEEQKKLVFYCRAGENVRMDVCCGEYKVSYAYGKTWYGTDQLFGPDTKYGELDKTLEFTNDKEFHNGWSIKLTWFTKGKNVTDCSL